MNRSLEIGKIMGIPVRLHWTLLLIILYVAAAFVTFSQDIYGRTYGFGDIEPQAVRWIYSLAFALILFICVAAHELGHSLIAHRSGVAIKSITLYFFGGVAAMEELPRNPGLELKMAFAGPAASGLLGLAFAALSEASAALSPASALSNLFWTLGIMNLVLMAFNMLPAFPMDGGRLLRAWFAGRMPYAKATRLAADIGKIFATLMFLLGLFYLNFMLIFVAFFVYVGAAEEGRATEISLSLEGIKVADIMSRQVRDVSPDMTLQELKELMFKEKHRGYPVFEDGVLRGIVTISDLLRVPEEKRAVTRVGDVMARKLYVIAPDERASTAMKMMNELQIHRLPVMDGGHLAGILSREDLVRAIELSSERGA
ncbi:MAG TPA: M50 family metallopeptidase [Methanothrix sp.]|jgi:Zn-dependent protease|nr:CBS domain-containing protein [Methanothrix sp.]HOV81150.1 M50 family metallopeptidase [Methanothrix sp.]HPC88941.1 M50 family metallopeptidase [Methanothrix sp.]HQE86875.1 M50 family metallopeptidase [Methanothrix sp.]HQI67514.1 M50 family metallopeptidase [Methanothrix sp.]